MTRQEARDQLGEGTNLRMYESDPDENEAASPQPASANMPPFAPCYYPNLSSGIVFNTDPVRHDDDDIVLSSMNSKLKCDQAPWTPGQGHDCWTGSMGLIGDDVAGISQLRLFEPENTESLQGDALYDVQQVSVHSEFGDDWETETITEDSRVDTLPSVTGDHTEDTIHQPSFTSGALVDSFSKLNLDTHFAHGVQLASDRLAYRLGNADSDISSGITFSTRPEPEKRLWTTRSCQNISDNEVIVQEPSRTPGKDGVLEDRITFELSEDAQRRLSHTSSGDPELFRSLTISCHGDCIGVYPEITPDMTSQQNTDGDTLLHIAVIHNLHNLVYFILNIIPSNFILDIFNNLTQTPLHLAVVTHQHKIVRRLVARGARVDMKDRNGDTPLHVASRTGCVDCTKALSTPVHRSEIGNCLYRVFFQCIPQDKSLLNYNGESCLHLAAASRKLEVLQYLLSVNVSYDVNLPHGRTGRTILHETIRQRHLEVIMFLVENRAVLKLNVNATAFDGLTALQLARDTQQRDIVFLLLLVGAKDDGIG